MRGKYVSLTKREVEVVRLLADGHTAKEASRLMHLHYDTVRNLLYDVRMKMGAKTTVQAMYLVGKEGMLDAGGDEARDVQASGVSQRR